MSGQVTRSAGTLFSSRQYGQPHGLRTGTALGMLEREASTLSRTMTLLVCFVDPSRARCPILGQTRSRAFVVDYVKLNRVEENESLNFSVRFIKIMMSLSYRFNGLENMYDIIVRGNKFLVKGLGELN